MLNLFQHLAELVEAHSSRPRDLILDVARATVDGEVLGEMDGDPTAAR